MAKICSYRSTRSIKISTNTLLALVDSLGVGYGITDSNLLTLLAQKGRAFAQPHCLKQPRDNEVDSAWSKRHAKVEPQVCHGLVSERANNEGNV